MSRLVDITHLRASIARLSEAREQIKAWTEIEKQEKTLILDAVAEGIGSVSGVPAVTVTDQVRRGLDTTRLKLEYPQLAVDFATEISYKVVRVL